MNSADRKCEVCGEPATVQVRDLKEVEPKKDEHGKAWCQWETDETHNYCAEHKRPSRKHKLDGSVREF